MIGEGGAFAYLDSSAFVKLVVAEPESVALRRYVHQCGDRAVSARLLRTEVLRAAARVSEEHMTVARRHLRSMAFIELDRDVLEAAATLTPPLLRSLDAIHIAAALSLGEDMGEFVAYDIRIIEAARAHGMSVISPE